MLLLVVSCQSREIYKPASQAVSKSYYSLSTDNFREGLTTKKIKIEGFPEQAEVKLTWWKGEEQYEGKEVYRLKWSK